MELSIGLYIAILVSSILSIILALVGSIFGILAFINVKALQKSTHSVQYMPFDPSVDSENQEFLDKENWASSEEAITKENKLYESELEDEMPQFYQDEDATKTRFSL